MSAEIIDQANELAQQRIDMAIAAHRTTATPYQLNIVVNAERVFRRRGALPFPAARHARNVRQT